MILAIIEGRETGREFSVTQRAVIGRDLGADVVIPDSDISGKHAALVLVDGGIAVEDLGSTGGTFVNDQRVRGSYKLEAGDRIRLGTTVLEVRTATPAPAAAEAGREDRQRTRVRQIETVVPPTLAATEVTPSERRITRTRVIPTVPLLIFV